MKGNNRLDSPKGQDYNSKDNIVPIWIRQKSSGNYSPVRHLASAAFPFSDEHKYMLMLSAYMDETGHSSDLNQKYVGMAGLIAPVANWEEFESKWKAALELPYIDLPYFHTTDFASKKKVYKTWNEEKRKLVYSKLITVMETAHALPFGALVPMDLYRKLADEHKEYFGDPYFIGFQLCLVTCANFLDEIKAPPEEKIALVFSNHPEFRNKALKLYEMVKPFTLLSRCITPPIFRDMREIVPLQAADIIAYEMYKEFDRQLTAPTREPRTPYQRIVKMSARCGYPVPMFYYVDEQAFAAQIEVYNNRDKVFAQIVREGKFKLAS